MTPTNLIDLLDETIDSITEPLFNQHKAGNQSAQEIALQLGLHLLDRGCSIVARSGLPLDGLDVAVVAAEDRAYAMSAVARQRADELPEKLRTTLIPSLRRLADIIGSMCIEFYQLAHEIER